MVDKPQHQRELRPPTPGELGVIRAEAGPEWASYGCLFLFWLLPGLGTPLMGWALAGRIGAVIGALLSVAALLAVLAWFRQFDRKRQSRGERDLVERQVESLTVVAADVVELDSVGDNDPALCFQIAPSTLLLLQGQWLREPSVYGSPESGDDPLDDRLNGLPDPFGFPTPDFEVVRLPHSGRVLSLKPAGEYVNPRQVHGDLLDLDRHPADSEILPGTLEQLRDALAAPPRGGRHE